MDDSINIQALRNAIPPHCFHPSIVLSVYYLVRDLCAVVSLAYFALYIPQLQLGYMQIVLWAAYGFVQGLFGTGLWIIAHECGHRAYFANDAVNNMVGWFLHSLLGVPYFSWKITHHQHHMYTGNMDKDTAFVPARKEESEAKPRWLKNFDHFSEDTPILTALRLIGHQLFGFQMYLLASVTAGKKSNKRGKRTWWNTSHFDMYSVCFRESDWNLILLSDLGLVLLAIALFASARRLGGWTTFFLYGLPYMWVNHWLVAITYMHHTHPGLSYYESDSWTFANGVISTVDRDFGWIGRNLFHNIIEDHVVHHLFSRIPFYYAPEATRAIKPVLGSRYTADYRPFLQQLWTNFRRLNWVEAVASANGVGIVRVWPSSQQAKL